MFEGLSQPKPYRGDGTVCSRIFSLLTVRFSQLTVSYSKKKYIFIFFMTFKLGKIGISHNHRLAIFLNFYYDATKLLQADNRVKIKSNYSR